MIASTENTNPSCAEVIPSASARSPLVIAVGRSWKCPSCAGRRLLTVTPNGGEVGALKGGDRSCIDSPGDTCMWDAARDRVELARRVDRRSS